MKRSRILIIENSIAITGALESAIRSSNYLSDKFDFVFLLPKNSLAAEKVRAKGFSVWELPMKELRRSLHSILVYLPVLLINTLRLKWFIRKENVDFIVCNDFYNLLPVVNKILFGGTNYICYVRFRPSKFPRALVRLWFGLHHAFAKRIIAVSEAVKRELPANKKTIIIYNELPAEQATYSFSSSSIILYPANYISGKGQEYALTAFSKICNQYPQWTLRFVGGDMGLEKNKQFKKRLEMLSEELGIDGQVQWNDFNNNLKEDYLNAGIVLNFSDSESFSLTCLEAMYFGRPVIATKCGGPEEIIDHPETGILVGTKDIEGMANAIDHLLKDQHFREKIGRRAFSVVREKFGHNNTRERLLSVYLEHLGEITK